MSIWCAGGCIVSTRSILDQDTSSFIQTFTVGFGISPNLRACARGLYRQSGIAPCPEDVLCSVVVIQYSALCIKPQARSCIVCVSVAHIADRVRSPAAQAVAEFLVGRAVAPSASARPRCRRAGAPPGASGARAGRRCGRCTPPSGRSTRRAAQRPPSCKARAERLCRGQRAGRACIHDRCPHAPFSAARRASSRPRGGVSAERSAIEGNGNRGRTETGLPCPSAPARPVRQKSRRPFRAPASPRAGRGSAQVREGHRVQNDHRVDVALRPRLARARLPCRPTKRRRGPKASCRR